MDEVKKKWFDLKSDTHKKILMGDAEHWRGSAVKEGSELDQHIEAIIGDTVQSGVS